LIMNEMPSQIGSMATVDPEYLDDAFILAASWEERCLTLPMRAASYRCERVLFAIYDGESKLREDHIKILEPILQNLGRVERIPSVHADPLPSVRAMLLALREIAPNRMPRVSIDISTFTRKHVLQLLNGLDHAGMSRNCQLYYTEPEDYQTHEDEAAAIGISGIETIPTLSGSNRPSRNSLLVLFLGYEGRRTLALWEHLEPHTTIAVIPDPPYRPEWRERTEAQNRYLLSCLPKENILRSHSMRPAETEELLERLIRTERFGSPKYDYWIAPFGTRPQLIGVYRFWRRRPGMVNIVYARPVKYLQEYTIPAARTWLLDRTSLWPEVVAGTAAELDGQWLESQDI
jgi:hypothetical protein